MSTGREGQPENKRQCTMEDKGKETSKKWEVVLTDEEQKIFSTLLDVVKTSGCGSILRAAGGWVRDKVKRKERKKKQ